jgi:hypothetical protein
LPSSSSLVENVGTGVNNLLLAAESGSETSLSSVSLSLHPSVAPSIKSSIEPRIIIKRRRGEKTSSSVENNLIFGGSLAPTSTGVDSALTAEEPGADLLKMLASAAEIGGEVIQVAVIAEPGCISAVVDDGLAGFPQVIMRGVSFAPPAVCQLPPQVSGVDACWSTLVDGWSVGSTQASNSQEFVFYGWCDDGHCS